MPRTQRRLCDKFYVAERELKKGWGHHYETIDLDVNGPVKFAIEKDNLYMLDNAGKEWKLRITKHGITESK